MSTDVTMEEHIGWAFPEQWVCVMDMEDDESNLTVTYEAVNVEVILDVAKNIFNGDTIPYHLTVDGDEWVGHLKEAMKSPESEDALTLEETLEGVKYWVEDELNSTLKSYAEEKFESYKSGEEWENYYD
jgi:hypothetical protein